jgi:hypothetical protein
VVDVLHDHRPARGQARGHAPQDLGDVGQVDEQEPRIDDVVALPLQGAHGPLPEQTLPAVTWSVSSLGVLVGRCGSVP